MGKIRRINLYGLRNEEWFNFFTEFKGFVEAVSAQGLKIDNLFATFLILYAMADEAIEKIRMSSITAEMPTWDKKRNNTFRGLVMAIESGRHHFDENKRAAAEHLNPVLSQYGNLAAKPYNEETAGIYNFLQELRGNYANDIQTLELREWVDELERNNQEFEQAVLERNRENAGKTDLQLMDVRRQTNRCYLDIVERLEALMLIEEDANYAVFVKTLNTNIERYKIALAQRKGRNKIKN
jgi:hypothetical protein